MVSVQLDGVGVDKDGTAVLRDVSVEIGAGDVLAVLGSSGSGKTTLLRAIAGLDRVERGAVRFGGRDVTGEQPADRHVAFVFQRPVLFPKRSVRGNISFPLEIDHRPIDEIRERVGAEARALQIEALLRRRPKTLSAGEAQAVQIARALVKQPSVLLLDEPFANVDAHLTAQFRREVTLIQRGFGVTTVMAANESADAMTMADRVAVLEGGRVVQVAPPLDIYDRPRTVNAALLTGAADVLEVEVEHDGDGSWLVRPGVRIRVWAPALERHRGRRLQLLVRPEWWQLDPAGRIAAAVDRVERQGSHAALWCVVDGRPMTVKLDGSPAVAVGDQLRLRLDRYVLIDPRDGYRIDLAA